MKFLLFSLVVLSTAISRGETLQNLSVKIENEWNKLSVQQSPKVGPTFNVGAMGSLTASIGYNYQVSPAGMQDFHQRVDGYGIRIGGNTLTTLGVGLSAEAQISFSRLFSKKIQALTALPRGPQKFPYSADQAQRHLDVGSAARFELASDGHIGANFSRAMDIGLAPFAGQLSASISRGKRYIVDVYRLDSDRVRLRMIATRNMGTLGTQASLGPLTAMNFGLGFVDHVLNNILRCELISVEKSTSASKKLPVDTMMVDYVINLNTRVGYDTYNQFFQNLLTMDVVEQLGLYQDPDVFYSSLWTYAQVVDDAFQNEKQILDPAQRAVQRKFKGRTLTDFRSINVESGCFILWDVSKEVYHGTTSVRSYDENEFTQNYFYLSTQSVSERDFLWQLFDEVHSLSFNTLFHAIRWEENNPLSLTPTGLADLVLVRSFKDKKFFGKGRWFIKSEIEAFKKDIAYQYPQFFSNIDWKDFVKTKKVAFSRMEMIFNARSVSLIRLSNYSETDLHNRLTQYVQGYIKRVGAGALSSTSGANPNGAGNSKPDTADKMARFRKDIDLITRRLAFIFQQTGNVEAAVKSFSSLRKNPLFQDIGAGFVLTLIPANELKSVVEATLTVGADNTPAIEVSHRIEGASYMYSSVDHILSVINDRSFDMRLQKDVVVQ